MGLPVDEPIDAREALKNLYYRSEELKQDPDYRKTLQHVLGKRETKAKTPNRKTRDSTSDSHESLAKWFHDRKKIIEGDEELLNELISDQNIDLRCLLAKGHYGRTILHTVLDPDTYSQESKLNLSIQSNSDEALLNLDKIKPFIHFLLKIDPSLPMVYDIDWKIPLFSVIDSKLNVSQKVDLVNYLCGNPRDGEMEMDFSYALQSLKYRSRPEANFTIGSHAIHKAIAMDVPLDFEIVKRASQQVKDPVNMDGNDRLCLEVRDTSGKTCLHIALTKPFTQVKLKWAERLAEFKPSLLNLTTKAPDDLETLTPLQHFTKERFQLKSKEAKKTTNEDFTSMRKSTIYDKDMEFRNKPDPGSELTNQNTEISDSDLNKLEDRLKRICLMNFDDSTVKTIMYTEDNMRETYLGFQEDDIVSGKSLKRLRNHYKLDNLLRCIYVPKINVTWDEDSITAWNEAKSWKCVGRTDYYIIFNWLKDATRGKVKKALEIVVDDSNTPDKLPHSDDAIFHCLDGLEIEIWDWQRLDISSDLIFRVAGNYVRDLRLYCSGLDAVLRSWSDVNGLPRLTKLETVRYEIHQGLESVETIHKYIETFNQALKDNFRKVNEKELKEVQCTRIIKKEDGEKTAASKVKKEGEDGYEEQEWLKCMDGFADIVEELDDKEGEVKVALIDDGVRSNYAGLDDNIETGMTCATGKRDGSTPRFKQNYNYNISQYGHGTVMAYFIRRVCPKVRLFVAKLDGKLISRGVTFSIESAAKAIEWAISKDVDIISMSWAIDVDSDFKDEERLKPLKDAISKAVNRHILLFCANPDNGIGYKNNTYPRQASPENIFCVGAATKDGNRWGKIASNDESCDLYLPGVELGIPVETRNYDRKDRPPNTLDKYSGSSVSCALAAGLAAMILHVAKINNVTNEEWKYLKRNAGMDKAFENIYRSEEKWIPVQRVFGPDILKRGSHNDKLRALRNEVLAKFLKDMPRADYRL